MAVDLGNRTTKAVLLERRGDVLALTRYALLDAPIYDKKMSPELLARLAKISNIVGVKEASGSLKQMNDVLDLCGPDFDVLSGDDGFTLPLMAIGGKGIISVASNIVPADMVALVDAAFEGHLAKARALHQKMSPLFPR